MTQPRLLSDITARAVIPAERGVPADSITYIAACGEGVQWRQALCLSVGTHAKGVPAASWPFLPPPHPVLALPSASPQPDPTSCSSSPHSPIYLGLDICFCGNFPAFCGSGCHRPAFSLNDVHSGEFFSDQMLNGPFYHHHLV